MRFYKHLMFNYPWFSKHLTCIKIFDFYSHLLKLIGIMINFKDEKKKGSESGNYLPGFTQVVKM